MDIDAIEKRIRDAIAKVQAAGWRLEPFITYDDARNTCCAVGALGIDALEGRRNWSFDDIEHEMNIDELDLSSIAEGFDGKKMGAYGGGIIDAFDLGARLRAEFIARVNS